MAQFDYKGARDAGYSDEEITDYLAGQIGFDVTSALQSGYGFDEISQYLTEEFAKPPEPAPVPVDLAPPAPQPEEEEVDSGFFRQSLDVPVQLTKGVTTGVRLISDFFGADSPVSQSLRSVEGFLDDLLSAQSKQDSKEIARILAEVENKGATAQLKAALEAFTIAPIDLVVNALGTSAPILAAGVLGGGYGLLAAGTAGTLMCAGTVKSSIYDAVLDELVNAGVPEDKAKQAAEQAQSYGGENLDQILVGGALGTLASITGLEAAAMRGLMSRAIGKAVAKDLAETTATKTISGQALRSGAVEAGTEFTQAGQEQLASNLALIRDLGMDVDPMRGVIGAGALEGLAGGVTGTVAGGVEVAAARRAAKQIADAGTQEQLDTTVVNIVSELGDEELTKDFSQRAEEAIKEDAAEVETEVETEVKETFGQEQIDQALSAAGEAEAAEEAEKNTELDAQEKAEEEAREQETAENAVIAQAATGAPVDISSDLTSDEQREAELEGNSVYENIAKNRKPRTPIETVTLKDLQREEEEAAKNKEERKAARKTDAKLRANESRAAKGSEVYFNTPATTQLETVFNKALEREKLVFSKELLNDMKEVSAGRGAALGVERNNNAAKAIQVYEQTQNQVQTERVERLADAYRIVNKNRKLSTKAAQAADRIIKNTTFTDAERKAAQARASQSPELSTYRADALPAVSVEPRQEFTQFQTPVEAADNVIETGTRFEKTLATRLRNVLRNVDYQVVTDINQIENENDRAGFYGDGNIATGYYGNQSKIIYLNNIEGSNTGLDNSTFLHESVHAGTVDIINEFEVAPENLNERQRMLVQELKDLQGQAKRGIEKKLSAGTATDMEKALYDVGAFDQTTEFVSYGITNADMQRFLMSIDGIYDTGTRTFGTLLSKFVDAIRRIFNISKGDGNAFYDLVILTDNLISEVNAIDASPNSVFVAAARKLKKQEKVAEKVDKSRTASETTDSISEAIKESRSFEETKSILDAALPTMSRRVIKKILVGLSTDDIMRWAGDRIKNFKVATKEINNMAGWRNKEMLRLLKQYDGWAAWAKRYQKAQKTLTDLAFISTLLGADPVARNANGNRLTEKEAIDKDEEIQIATAKLNDPNTKASSKPSLKAVITKRTNDIKVVYKLYDKLQKEGGNKGVELYEMAKNEYARLFDENIQALRDIVNAQNMEAEDKNRLLAKIDLDFQEAKKKGVYFPLVRYGQFWLRVGKGRSGEFYMFESGVQRDLVARKIAQEKGSTVDALMEAQDMDIGDDATNLRKAIESEGTSGQMLKSVYSLIDSAKQNSTGLDTDMLKDSIYQLYLMTLPNQSIRRRFIKRQGKTGFNTDVLRNYATVQSTTINQLARLKYKNKIENAVSAAYGELEGMPREKLKLRLFVEEFDLRVKEELSPADPNELLSSFATLGNKTVFYYMMTAPRSALVQLTQLPLVGFPILETKYGRAKTASVAFRYLNLFKKLRPVEVVDGNVKTKWGAPSIEESEYIVNNPDKERGALLGRAWTELSERDVFMATYASDMTSRGGIDTRKPRDPVSKGFNFLLDFMGGAFHHTERISREIMGMSSFELAYDAEIAKGVDPEQAYQTAIDSAISDTYEGLFNYSQFNKPRIARRPLGRLATQFMTYPLQMTSYLVRNFYNSWKIFNKNDREAGKIAAERFFTTLTLTALYAGVTGLPMYGLIVGMLDAYRELMRPDPEEDEEAARVYDMLSPDNPFGKRNSDLRFRDWTIPHYFGYGSSIANFLNLSETEAQRLARGVELGFISAYTDANIGSSVSLNGLWFRDDTESDSSKDAITRLMFRLFGPFGGMAQQLGQAYDDFKAGDIQRGGENLLPAFFRGAAKSYRLGTEGARTRSGDQVKEAEFYHMGKLLVQSLGFVSTEEAELQKSNILAKGIQAGIERERNTILKNADRYFQDIIDNPDSEKARAAFEEFQQEIIEFNFKNPFVYISGATLNDSLSTRLKNRLGSSQGLSVPDNYAPIIYPMVQSSRTKKD